MMKWNKDTDKPALYVLIVQREGQSLEYYQFDSMYSLKDYVFRKELDRGKCKIEVCQNIHWPGDASLN